MMRAAIEIFGELVQGAYFFFVFFLTTAFTTFFLRLRTPYDPFIILPLLLFLSPLPIIIVFIFEVCKVNKNFHLIALIFFYRLNLKLFRCAAP